MPTTEVSFTGEETGEIRSQLARRHLENVELWLRRLVHYQLCKDFGPDFYRIEGVLKSDIRKRLVSKFDRDPASFSRVIDASTMDDVIGIVSNPRFWKNFQPALAHAYPHGHEEARTFLSRLGEIRNMVSHGRTCSSRHCEQVVCYSNDVIDSIQEFYKEEGMEKVFNAPFFTRYKNNLGLDLHFVEVNAPTEGNVVFYYEHGFKDTVPGERIIVEVEVDPSFDRSTYGVTWNIQSGPSGEGLTADFIVTNEHVGVNGFRVDFRLISSQNWHRFNTFDDSVRALYRALPLPG